MSKAEKLWLSLRICSHWLLYTAWCISNTLLGVSQIHCFSGVSEILDTAWFVSYTAWCFSNTLPWFISDAPLGVSQIHCLVYLRYTAWCVSNTLLGVSQTNTLLGVSQIHY